MLDYILANLFALAVIAVVIALIVLLVRAVFTGAMERQARRDLPATIETLNQCQQWEAEELIRMYGDTTEELYGVRGNMERIPDHSRKEPTERQKALMNRYIAAGYRNSLTTTIPLEVRKGGRR